MKRSLENKKQIIMNIQMKENQSKVSEIKQPDIIP
jgi:hypothetical protein